jgi:hypothetical protein
LRSPYVVVPRKCCKLRTFSGYLHTNNLLVSLSTNTSLVGPYPPDEALRLWRALRDLVTRPVEVDIEL